MNKDLIEAVSRLPLPDLPEPTEPVPGKAAAVTVLPQVPPKRRWL